MPLPSGCQGLLEVSTLRKRHMYATPTTSDAETWVNALRQARGEAIKRHMGHTPAPSYPPSWKAFDTLGQALVQRKERIHRRIQESRIQELELSNMTEGATAPRGYFG
jgi:Tfp pilus assembly protein FimT